jgi:hypothetical protein
VPSDSHNPLPVSDDARVRELEAEVARLREALARAHEQLIKFDYKGPKQVGRAMLTIEQALGWPTPLEALEADER